VNENPSDTEMTELHTDVERTGQAPEAAAAEQPAAGEGTAVNEQAPQVGPSVEEPSAEVAPATEESSADVAPAAGQASAESTTAAAQSEQPAAEAPAAQDPDDAQAPAAEAAGDAPASAEQTAGDSQPQAEVPPAGAVKPRVPISTEDPPPGTGPKILGMAEDLVPPPVPPVKASLKDLQRQRPRRRRLNATQRHRNVFFARLNEFRRQAQAGRDPRTDAEAAEAEAAEAQAAEAAEAQAADAAEAQAAEAPAAGAEGAPQDAAQAPAADAAGEGADAPAAEGEAAQAQPEQRQQSKRRSAPPPPVDRPRLIAAIERAGGPEVVIEALQPKRDENDQPLKWATVCADACKGLKPSDPVFSAWIRLAATPVSAIKNELGLNERRDERRRRGPRRDRRRDDRRGGISREDYQRHVIGGRVGANIRIIGLERLQGEKKEREERRKAEREAKREAERERLARLGY
jgi:hypothetical protein